MSVSIEINLEECTGCKACLEACFVDVMRWDDAGDKPVAAYEQDCVWCFTCEVNCPAQCINVVPHLGGQRVGPY